MSAYILGITRRSRKLFKFQRIRSYVTAPSTCDSTEDDDVNKKIIYSSKMIDDKKRSKLLRMKEKSKMNSAREIELLRIQEPISMKYLPGFDDFKENEVEMVNEEAVDEMPSVMPISLKLASNDVLTNIAESEEEVVSENSEPHNLVDGSTRTLKQVWNNDYVKYTHNLEDESEIFNEEWIHKYGTSNVNIPSSKVPCGGCGAVLHCLDQSIPGFIPQEMFTQCKTDQLRSVICQRCHFLQNHNTALSVAVDPAIYPKMLSKIRSKSALVLLAVDLTDFPCSIWPGIVDLVGESCPIFIVGNKVDLLWGDSSGWMARVEKSLRSCFPQKAKILGTQLISAWTGFGVEELISKLHNTWEYQGDVYLVGCTNVGKSTLFNALLQSDYCKTKAVDLVQRATTAPWPGTTLNLLKFPILRPEGWRVYLRTRRLKMEEARHRLESQLRKEQKQDAKKERYVAPQLIGHIGRTFHRVSDSEEDPFSAPDYDDPKEVTPGSGLNPNDPDFRKGRWFYDTPGVLHHDQILDLLTTDELVEVLPKKIVKPRNVLVKPGMTIFIGGLARVDFLPSDSSEVKWSIFVSRQLPITVCDTKDAEELYNKLLGTELFGVPSGDSQRLAKWPALAHKNEFKFAGINKMICCGDIVLSSCGWVSFAPPSKEIIRVKPWTPGGRGIYTRTPALLPHAAIQRGILIKGQRKALNQSTFEQLKQFEES